jgi:hypothetical protein
MVGIVIRSPHARLKKPPGAQKQRARESAPDFSNPTGQRVNTLKYGGNGGKHGGLIKNAAVDTL